jgi:tetratricopeptide (TPR) repeat protein
MKPTLSPSMSESEILKIEALSERPEWRDPLLRARLISEIVSSWEQDAQAGEATLMVRVRRPSAQSRSQVRGVGAKAASNSERDARAASRSHADAYTGRTPSILTHTPPDESIYNPDGSLNTSYLIRNAELLRGAGEPALARNIYQTLLQSGERTALAWHGIGECLESEGKLDDARKAFEDAIAYQPSIESYRALAGICLRQNRWLEAADTFDRALHLKDLAPTIRYELHKAAGNAFLQAQRFVEAEAHYRKGLDADPLSDEMRTNLGALYLELGKTFDARRCFEDAVASNPRNPKATSGLATLAMLQGDKKLAHDLFTQSLNLDLNQPTAIFHLVKVAYELRSYAVAARIVEDYIEIAPINLNLLYSLAGLQFHLGRLESARSTCDRMLQIAPDHTGARELIARIAKFEGASH